MIASNIFLFLSTLSLRRATLCAKTALAWTEFLSTLSLRRATDVYQDGDKLYGDFYPRSPCGERRDPAGQQMAGSGISIHALLAESDRTDFGNLAINAVISIHALLAESDTQGVFNLFANPDFYPRSPCGERRESQQPCARPTRDFYPRSPCGERRAVRRVVPHPVRISIHALLAESDSFRAYRSISCI